jgi:DNA-binding IclR family transcriptional regulator
VSILSFLTAHPSRGFTISELVHHLGMNIASAHATLAVLSDAGFIVRDPVHRTYVLGPALAATGFAALEQHPAITAAMGQAEILAVELDTEISVTALAGRDVVLLARRGPAPGSTGVGYPGDRAPMMAPIGAVFMAWADDEAVDAWLDRADASPAAATHYRAVLDDIRAQGFSVPLESIAGPEVMEAMERVRDEPTDDRAEHELAGVLQATDGMLLRLEAASTSDEVLFRTVAAPIFDELGRVVLSISITGPVHPVAVDEVLRLGHRLVESATIATHEGRGRVPGDDALLAASPLLSPRRSVQMA